MESTSVSTKNLLPSGTISITPCSRLTPTVRATSTWNFWLRNTIYSPLWLLWCVTNPGHVQNVPSVKEKAKYIKQFVQIGTFLSPMCLFVSRRTWQVLFPLCTFPVKGLNSVNSLKTTTLTDLLSDIVTHLPPLDKRRALEYQPLDYPGRAAQKLWKSRGSRAGLPAPHSP